MSIDPMVSLASSVQSGPGVFALLLGSGVSKSAGVPTGWEIIEILVQRVATAEGADINGDPISWYVGRFEKDPDYSVLVEELARCQGDRVNLMKGFFEQSDDDQETGAKEPSEAHRAVAGLVAKGFVKVIVTTNFDQLLEWALFDRGVTPTVIADSASARDALPLTHTDITVIKVNGDYLSPNFKNTMEELGSYDDEMDRLLHEVFTQYGLLVCGWSAEYDPALREAIKKSKPPPFATYWLHKGTIEPESKADRLISHRKAIQEVLTVEIGDAGTALGNLEVTVDALSEDAEQRALGADVAVARLKKLLPEESHWIRLHSLMTDETQVAIAEFETLEMSERMRNRQISIQEQMDVYEMAMARLLRLLVVGARFSNREDHYDLWAECVDRLIKRKMHPGPVNEGIFKMQFYPALLAVYAIALGSAVAGRVEPIAHILTAVTMKRPLSDRSVNGPIPVIALVECLINDRFPVGVTDRSDPTPRSDHLFGVLHPASADLIVDDERLEDFFEEVEYLLGLSCTAQLSPHGIRYVAPLGRAVKRMLRGDDHSGDLVQRHAETFIEKGVFQDTSHLNAIQEEYQEEFKRFLRWLDPDRFGLP